MQKKRLFWHLYISYILIIFASVFVISYNALKTVKEFYLNQVEQNLETKAYYLKSQIAPLLQSNNYEQINNLCDKLGSVSSTRITVIAPDGKVIGDSEENPELMVNHADRPEFLEVFEKGIGKKLRFSSTLEKQMMYVAVPIRSDNQIISVLRTSVPVNDIDKILKTITNIVIRNGLIFSIVAAILGLLISRRISFPLEQLRKGAEHFSQGDFTHKISVESSVEINSLAESMNKMAKDLGEKINTITRQRNEQQAILSSMNEGVLALDVEGNIISINHSASEILKVNPVLIEGKKVTEIIRNPDLQAFVEQTLIADTATQDEFYLPSGSDKLYQLQGASLLDNQGKKAGAVIVLRDMTRIRKLENMRKNFVANVSHELKTPITSIKGFVETLISGAIHNPDEAKRFLKIISRHSERLNAIIDDLLSLSSLEEDKDKKQLAFQISKIKAIIRSAIELSNVKAIEKNIRINLDCPEDFFVKVNPALMEQAVVNLIDNAIKYSEADQRIDINVKTVNNHTVIHVKDHGCGISKKHLPHLFERFYVVDKARSRNLGGTGLGLAIVKHITQLHRGSVTVESEPGKGSTFSIKIPNLN